MRLPIHALIQLISVKIESLCVIQWKQFDVASRWTHIIDNIDHWHDDCYIFEYITWPVHVLKTAGKNCSYQTNYTQYIQSMQAYWI